MRRNTRYKPYRQRPFRRKFLLPIVLLLLIALIAWASGKWGGSPPALLETTPSVGQRDDLVRKFGFCHSGGGTNCVVDGDTIWLDGEKIRVADIDTPETHGPKCDEEMKLGQQATRRLQALLNEGAFSLETNGDRDVDRYGRKLRILTRRGESLGDILVEEGLARPWGGRRQPWCAEG